MSPVTVVKVGGNRVDDREWVRALARRIASRPGWTVLVHGGGKEVSELQRSLGVVPEWRDGLRVTPPDAMRAVSMILSGLVNKRLVAALLDAGTDAVGISGEDGALLRAAPVRGGALGRTGEVTEVRAALLRAWLEEGLTPVVSPVSRGGDGGALNVNADDAAAAISRALGAAELLLVSDVPGVRGGAGELREVNAGEIRDLIADGTVSGGMVPKLRAAARAAGDTRVRVGGLEMLGDPDAGTRIRRSSVPTGVGG